MGEMAAQKKAFAESQSPLTGQFNFYLIEELILLRNNDNVSIPSNGSIQFLSKQGSSHKAYGVRLNPL